MMNFKFISLVFLAFGLFGTSLSQEKDGIGIYGSYGFLLPESQFEDLQGIDDCCPQYADHTGMMFNFGLDYRYQLSKLIYIKPELGLTMISNSFEYEEEIGNLYDASLNTVPGFSMHTLENSFSLVNLNIMAGVDVAGYFDVLVGLQNGFLVSASSQYNEELQNPNYSFLDGDGLNNEFDGELPELNGFQNWVSLGLSKDIEVGSGIILAPFALFNLNTTDMISYGTWKNSNIAGGIRIGWVGEEEPEKIEVQDTPPPPPVQSNIIADLNTKVDGLDTETNDATIIIEEYMSKQVYPLLNYVFFDEESSVLPARYRSLSSNEVRGYDYNSRYRSEEDLNVYYDILNIIGHRMTENPNANLDLVGNNSNVRRELSNQRLSENRAETVKKYLVDRWNVNPNRISIKAQNLPENESKGSTEDHYEENRRVELYSNDPKITAPVIVYDTLRIPDIPEVEIDFKAQTKNKENLDSWQLTISQFDNPKKVLTQRVGFGNADTTILWSVAPLKKDIPRGTDSIEVKLVARHKGEVEQSTSKIDIFQKTIEYKQAQKVENDKRIDEYRLIKFDHNSSDVNELHTYIIYLVCEDIKSDSEVFVTGYTDFMGSESGNMRLSQNRAKAIEGGMNCANSISSEGKGEIELKNIPNSLPEGRFYNRTVKVRVETPIRY